MAQSTANGISRVYMTEPDYDTAEREAIQWESTLDLDIASRAPVVIEVKPPVYRWVPPPTAVGPKIQPSEFVGLIRSMDKYAYAKEIKYANAPDEEWFANAPYFRHGQVRDDTEWLILTDGDDYAQTQLGIALPGEGRANFSDVETRRKFFRLFYKRYNRTKDENADLKAMFRQLPWWKFMPPIDIDPNGTFTRSEICEVARRVDAYLNAIGIYPLWHTTGGRGVHGDLVHDPSYSSHHILEAMRRIVVKMAKDLGYMLISEAGHTEFRKPGIYIDDTLFNKTTNGRGGVWRGAGGLKFDKVSGELALNPDGTPKKKLVIDLYSEIVGSEDDTRNAQRRYIDLKAQCKFIEIEKAAEVISLAEREARKEERLRNGVVKAEDILRNNVSKPASKQDLDSIRAATNSDETLPKTADVISSLFASGARHATRYTTAGMLLKAGLSVSMVTATLMASGLSTTDPKDVFSAVNSTQKLIDEGGEPKGIGYLVKTFGKPSVKELTKAILEDIENLESRLSSSIYKLLLSQVNGLDRNISLTKEKRAFLVKVSAQAKLENDQDKVVNTPNRVENDKIEARNKSIRIKNREIRRDNKSLPKKRRLKGLLLKAKLIPVISLKEIVPERGSYWSALYQIASCATIFNSFHCKIHGESKKRRKVILCQRSSCPNCIDIAFKMLQVECNRTWPEFVVEGIFRFDEPDTSKVVDAARRVRKEALNWIPGGSYTNPIRPPLRTVITHKAVIAYTTSEHLDYMRLRDPNAKIMTRADAVKRFLEAYFSPSYVIIGKIHDMDPDVVKDQFLQPKTKRTVPIFDEGIDAVYDEDGKKVRVPWPANGKKLPFPDAGRLKEIKIEFANEKLGDGEDDPSICGVECQDTLGGKVYLCSEKLLSKLESFSGKIIATRIDTPHRDDERLGVVDISRPFSNTEAFEALGKFSAFQTSEGKEALLSTANTKVMFLTADGQIIVPPASVRDNWTWNPCRDRTRREPTRC